MSEEIDNLVRRLESFERWLRINDYNDAPTVREAADQIKSLTAEVERLTPKPMAPDEIVATLNEYKVRGEALWELRNNHDGPAFLFMAREWDDIVAYSLPEANYIAQGLLRDAGPIVVEGGAS
jgi:hypothetical protein